MTTFAELGVDQDIVEALASKGIVDAFPIQEQTIPLGLPGQDIIGQAKTGTGKTFGFGIPVVQRLGLDPAPGVKALIVVPTRELAVQVYEDMDMLTSNRSTSVVAIYGGKAYEGQIDQLKAGAQIVVGTPGRLIDLNNQRLLDLSNATEVVLDEADKMLDLGFLPDIEKIIQKVSQIRHTQLFSATMPGPIVALARRFMSNPIHIRATDPDEGLTQANIRHLVYRAHSLDKDEVIARILQADGRGKTVIFTRTKRAAQRLSDELGDRGFNTASVHGDMSQEARERDDRAGHRCREEHGVTLGRGLREELLDVGEESEVEHLVGLVEDHDLDVLEAQQALAGEVEETPGGADDDLGAGLDLLDLSFVGLAAVDGRDDGGAVGGREGEVFGDLHAQLAGRHDDERLHAGLRVGTERLQQGEPETEGLARSGLGLADDVLAGETHRNGLGLDGEWFDDALGSKCVNHVLVDIEFSESHGSPVRLRDAPALSWGAKPPPEMGGTGPV